MGLLLLGNKFTEKMIYTNVVLASLTYKTSLRLILRLYILGFVKSFTKDLEQNATN